MTKKAEDAAENELAFWLRHVRIGVALSVVTGLVGLGYLAITWERPNREVLVVMLVAAVLGSLVIPLLPLRRILLSRRALRFFYAWTAATCVLILVGALLDRPQSPILVLYFLPLVYGAISYPPAGVAMTGALAVGGTLVAGLLGAVEPGRLLVLCATLTMAAVMCALTARNHWDQFATQSALARRLAHLALYDGLTGCLNHRAFHEALRLEADRARRAQRPLALLIVDLDEFKVVNDAYGHPAGDQVLAAIGETIGGMTREGDHVGRIGGDEFAVLLPETDLAEATGLAERLRGQVAGLTEPVGTTVSVGVAAMPDPGKDGSILLKRADEAVYAAKRAGKDQVAVHSPETV